VVSAWEIAFDWAPNIHIAYIQVSNNIIVWLLLKLSIVCITSSVLLLVSLIQWMLEADKVHTVVLIWNCISLMAWDIRWLSNYIFIGPVSIKMSQTLRMV
jgi:hypothetical protein